MSVHIVDWDNTGVERTEALNTGRMLTFCGLRIGKETGWTHPETAMGDPFPGDFGPQGSPRFPASTCTKCKAELTARTLVERSIE